MSKKTIYIILITVAGLLIIGGLVWYLFFASSQPAPSSGGADFTIPGGGAAQGKLKAISNGPVISAHLSEDNVLFYDFSGQLWQFGANDAKPVSVDQSPIKNEIEISWLKVFSPASPAGGPDGKKIIYQKNNSLFTSDSSGKNQRTLIGNLKLRDVVLHWPKINQISLTSRPSGLVAGSAWLLDTRNLSFTKLIDALFGLETLYSPDGNSFIYSYVDQNGRNPRVVVYKNGVSKNLDNISTLIDKCAWAKDSLNIFCAVPISWPDYMILPDDYYKKVGLTGDEIWKINTETGEKNLVAPNLGDVNNVIIPKDENSLYFVLRNNQYLYQLNLK